MPGRTRLRGCECAHETCSALLRDNPADTLNPGGDDEDDPEEPASKVRRLDEDTAGAAEEDSTSSDDDDVDALRVANPPQPKPQTKGTLSAQRSVQSIAFCFCFFCKLPFNPKHAA